MISVAISWQIYELTKRPLDLGLIGLAQFLPIAGFSLIGGQVADRKDRRTILLFCYLLMALCAFTFFVLSYHGKMSTFLVYSLLFLTGTIRAFWGPANQSFLPLLVSNDFFPKAAAWNTSSWQLAMILGPSLGGVIYGMSGKPWLVHGTSFLMILGAFCSTYAIAQRTRKLEQSPLSWKTTLVGIRYVWSEKVILGANSLDLFAVLLGGVIALLPAYASDILKVGPLGYGLLKSSQGIGATVSGVVLGLRPIERNIGVKLFGAVIGFGLFTILFGISKNFYLSFICLMLLGGLDMISVVARHSISQLRTPHEMRGRVSAVTIVFISASNELGEFESGITAQWFGLVPAVIVGGVGTCVITLLWIYLFPELRRLDRFVEKEYVSER